MTILSATGDSESLASAKVLSNLGRLKLDQGTFPVGAASGDFNNDGHQDLAVLNNNTGVTIFLGNGAGSFTLKTNIAVQGNYTSIVAGDFNGDGTLDLAFAGFTFPMNILLGNGDGTFNVSSFSYGSTLVYQHARADINHDGKLDLLGAQDYAGGLAGLGVFLGNGDGTFTYSLIQSPQYAIPISLAVGDFKGDGNPDVVIANSAGGLLLFFGNGAGGFTLDSSSYLPLAGAESVVSGDFNGDGKTDLAVLNGATSTVTTLGNGDGTFNAGAATTTIPGVYNLAVADLNLDGKMDLVAVSFSEPDANVLLGNGGGGFSSQTIALPATISMLKGITVADWNSDGRPDILFPDFFGTSGALLLNATTTAATATLSDVVVGGTVNQTINAAYSGSTSYGSSTSNSLTLVP